MITNLTKQDLIDFEEEIAEIYKTGVIRGPIHLRGGNEQQLIDVYKNIREQDVVLATWANHLEALLKGIPNDKIKERILVGHSMAMNFPEYNFYTSAIVNGISPIGVGMAWGTKKQKKDQRIYIFLGDMAFQAGASIESIRYSINFDLPCTWIIADNNLSVDTPTDITVGGNIRRLVQQFKDDIRFQYCDNTNIHFYSYKNKWPHSSVGTFISF